MLEYESKFLDKNYLATRLNDFPFKRKGFRYEIRDSKSTDSIYVDIWKDKLMLTSLRISDHIQDTKEVQFVIEPEKVLAKKKKALFVNCVNAVIRKAERKSLGRLL